MYGKGCFVSRGVVTIFAEDYFSSNTVSIHLLIDYTKSGNPSAFCKTSPPGDVSNMTAKLKLSTLYSHTPYFSLFKVAWTGRYLNSTGDAGRMRKLDLNDVHCVWGRDQIMIKKGCVKLRAPADCDGVFFINLKLPPEVRTVFVYKYGNCEPFCYFRQLGTKSYDAACLSDHPFKASD